MLPNLRATPHGYIYLKTVPADLVPAIGKTVTKKSLGRDFKLAKIRWAELEAETTRLFHDTRQQMALVLSAEDALAAFLKKDPHTRLKVLPAGRKGLAEQVVSPISCRPVGRLFGTQIRRALEGCDGT